MSSEPNKKRKADDSDPVVQGSAKKKVVAPEASQDPVKEVFDNDFLLDEIMDFLTPLDCHKAYRLAARLSPVSKQFRNAFLENQKSWDMNFVWGEYTAVVVHQHVLHWVKQHKLTIVSLRAVSAYQVCTPEYDERNCTDWLYKGMIGVDWSNLTLLDLTLYEQGLDKPRSVQFFSLFAQSTQLEHLNLVTDSRDYPHANLLTHESLKSVSIKCERIQRPLNDILRLPKLEALKIGSLASGETDLYHGLHIDSPTLKELDVADETQSFYDVPIVQIHCPLLVKLVIGYWKPGPTSTLAGTPQHMIAANATVVDPELLDLSFQDEYKEKEEQDSSFYEGSSSSEGDSGSEEDEVEDYEEEEVFYQWKPSLSFLTLPVAEFQAAQPEAIQVGMDCQIVAVKFC